MSSPWNINILKAETIAHVEECIGLIVPDIPWQWNGYNTRIAGAVFQYRNRTGTKWRAYCLEISTKVYKLLSPVERRRLLIHECLHILIPWGGHRQAWRQAMRACGQDPDILIGYHIGLHARGKHEEAYAWFATHGDSLALARRPIK